jgi:hypothetical protein
MQQGDRNAGSSLRSRGSVLLLLLMMHAGNAAPAACCCPV